jgi:hypothetical protein
VLTHLKAGVFAAFAPDPVTIAVCVQPTSVTAAKQFSPPETTGNGPLQK